MEDQKNKSKNDRIDHKKAGLKIPHSAIVKAPGLLPMLYTISELAEELSVPESILLNWFSYGAPHQIEAGGCTWINGTHFSQWIAAQKKQSTARSLAKNEAFCFHCKQVVQLLDPQIIPIQGKLIHLRGKCSTCGNIVNRGGRHG